MSLRLNRFYVFVLFFCLFQMHRLSDLEASSPKQFKIQVNDFVILLGKESSYLINKIFNESKKLVLNLKRTSSNKEKAELTAKDNGVVIVNNTEPSQLSPLSIKYRIFKAEQLWVTELFKDRSSMKNAHNLYQVLLQNGAVEKNLISKKLGPFNYLTLDLNGEGKLYLIPHKRSESIHKNFSKSKLALQRDYMIYLSETKIDFQQMAESYILTMKRSDYLHCESCE